MLAFTRAAHALRRVAVLRQARSTSSWRRRGSGARARRGIVAARVFIAHRAACCRSTLA